MKKIGVALLVVGGIGFAWASSVRGSYDSVEGALKSTFSSEERGRKSFADTGRWVALAVGVVGLVLVVMPARKA